MIALLSSNWRGKSHCEILFCERRSVLVSCWAKALTDCRVVGTQVRFGIMCGHELSELAADANTHQGFNQVLNTTQINNGLTSLSEQFAAARSR